MKGNNNPCDNNRPAQFEEVLDKELDYFAKRKRLKRKSDRKNGIPDHEKNDEAIKDKCSTAYAASIVEEANKAKLTGLAFSGGGIRSATFNLGVLQALARLKLLDQFDYLSTVSGGGYIGSWFTAWTHRKDIELREKNKSISEGSSENDENISTGLEAVSRELACSISAREDRRRKAAVQPDPAPIWHLREYSNYLSPRRGLWSADTWTLGITYIRNFALTFSLLLATLITLVLGIRVVATIYFRAAHGEYENTYVVVPVLFCLSIFCATLASGVELCGYQSNKQRNAAWSNLVIGSAGLAAATGALWLWQSMVSSQQGMFTQTLVNLVPWNDSLVLIDLFEVYTSLILSGVSIGVFALVGWIIGLLFGKWTAVRSQQKDGQVKPKKSLTRVGWPRIAYAACSVIAFLFLLMILGKWMLTWLPFDVEWWDPQLWRIVVWGAPLFVLVFSMTTVVFVGVAGGALHELEREWLGRVFAVLLKWTALTTFLVVLVIYSSCWVNEFSSWVKEFGDDIGDLIKMGVSAVWLALSSMGAFLARSAASGKSSELGWLKKTVMAVAPFVFILGMLILTVWVTDRGVLWVVMKFELIENTNEGLFGYWYLMAKIDLMSWLTMFVVSLVLVFLWSWRVGVNRFSLHSMYGDRLIRAYLGASNLKRNAHPFTGFCDQDNQVHLSNLAHNENSYTGPYPIINTAINLVDSHRLAWQKRKAASFFFTPLFCGYEFCGEQEENEEGDDGKTRRIGGFVGSGCYAGDQGSGLSIGKAMTISGAAASPNMGYHSSPALTFLMTTFNLRLGWWLPNTAKNNPDLLAKRGPGLGLLYLWNELIGKTSARSNYVYLSDGGHFENLGIYELVRRRCRIIVACDAEADPNMTFSGLGNAIEKCRTDLGVPINIDVAQIKPDSQTGFSLRHCAVGCIRYSEADPGQPDGTLIYIKSSLTGDEPQDVATYANGHTCFPHETTADQWFDETQFEGYRMLGEHTIEKVLANAVNVSDSVMQGKRGRTIEHVIMEARKQWYPESSLPVYETTDHDKLLGSIMDTLRTDVHLAFLDEQLYPNLHKVADTYSDKMHEHPIPESYKEFRAGFYFCKRLIQFMQQVYYDLDLDLEYAAPRNRGWMNLFRRWSWSRMIRFTWTMTAGTYGARFQSFCEHRLGLESGEPEFSEKPLEISATLSLSSNQHQIELVPPVGINDGFDWVDAEKQFGLHYYETRLIKEFIGAYVRLDDLKAYPQPYTFEVFPLKVTTDDPINEQVDKDMELNAGFLIAGPSLKNPDDKTSGFVNAILYFRIRPSMRNMDLARKALCLKRRNHNILKHYSICMDKELPVCKVPKSAWQRRAYRNVHAMNRDNLDHCRWFSQLMGEEEQGGEEQMKVNDTMSVWYTSFELY